MTQDIGFKNIVVGTDFRACSERALAMAERLARLENAELFVVHTVEPPSYAYTGVEVAAIDWLTPIREAAQQRLDGCIQQLTERGVRARAVLEVGSAWENILRVADGAQADLIVVGTHGRRGIPHALLGSVAEKLVRLAPMPVLTVRGGDGPAAARAEPNVPGAKPVGDDRKQNAP